MLHQIVYYNNVMYLLSIARYIYPKSFVGFVEHNKVIDEVDTAALHNNKTQAQVHVDLCIKSNCAAQFRLSTLCQPCRYVLQHV